MNITQHKQQAIVHRLLLDTMVILRDDATFEPRKSSLGDLLFINDTNYEIGKRYSFDNNAIPKARIELSTIDDPDDYRSDRQRVRVVPFELEFGVSPALADMNASTIKSLLQLEDFWVSDGEIIHENKLTRSPQTPDVQVFRYRSKNVEGSKFPVSVELEYYDPIDGTSPPELVHVSLRRAYSMLTPEEREQKRLEQEHAKRAKYGYMRLRTGMLCPETGWWEGWAAEGQIDKQVVRQNTLFPQAGFGPNRSAPDGARFVDAQWMWHGPYHDETSQ
ncbi:hypothetical protein [Caballeronia sp. RCC_10]|uniref:hypothetical protein n=1 Tax=Caballeronia sp. RCC_10 TaxID=3239227 RepID=UPI0035256DBB